MHNISFKRIGKIVAKGVEKQKFVIVEKHWSLLNKLRPPMSCKQGNLMLKNFTMHLQR